MAQASGLQLVPPERRDPMRTTSYGAGQLSRKALDSKVDGIIIGIGGSATNDGGAGADLGVRFALSIEPFFGVLVSIFEIPVGKL
jgi:glycerate 2-kinase